MKKFAGDIIIFTHVHQKSQSYDVWFSWDMECDRQFIIMDCFFPMEPENKNEKWKKKTLENIIIWQMFTINYNTIIWCMVFQIWSATDKTFCHFGAFLPFYLHYNQKNQNLEKMHLEISSFYLCKPKIMIR